MNLSTFGYNLMTGQWRLDRLAVKERVKLYAGARSGTKRPAPGRLISTEDGQSTRERIVLIRAARDVETDFPLGDSILSDFETYVVGNLRYLPDTGNSEADAVVSDFLETEFNAIDYAGKHDLTTLARLAMRTQKRDGQAGWNPIDEDDRITINAISGDRIGNPQLGTGIDPENLGGIHVDSFTGRVRKYEIYNVNPARGLYEKQVDLNPNDFFHFFDPFRFEQAHGVSVFKNGIENSGDIQQILLFAKLNMKYRASQLPIMQRRGGALDRNIVPGYGNAEPSSDVNATGLSMKVDGVMQHYVNLDEGAVEFPNDFPNGQFLPAITALYRDFCMSAKLPMEFCHQSQSGGVVQRFYADKAKKTFGWDKRHLQRVLLNPTKNRIIERGIKSGRLDLRKFGNLATERTLARFRGMWQMGEQISVDYGNEVDADIKLMEAGLMSADSYITESGENPETVRRQIKARAKKVIEDADEISKATGKTFDQVLPLIVKRFPNPVQQAQPGAGGPMDAAHGPADGAPDPAAIVAPAKALIETIGIGGTQSLVTIQQQVSSGTLPREQGINTLVILFGIDAATAGRLIPTQGSADPIADAKNIEKVI